MLKTDLYKQFLDEISPLSLFAAKIYPANLQIKPVLGNQGYDASVFDARGKEVDRIEITTPQDGAAKAADARLAITRGFGTTRVYDPGENLKKIIPNILTVCRAKARKDYSDSTLVIVVDFVPPLKVHLSLYDDHIEDLIAQVRTIRFRAKRVYLLVPPFETVHAIEG